MLSVVLINPNTSADTTRMMMSVAAPLLPPGVALRGVGAARGPAMILDEAALAASAEEVVRIGLAEAASASALIVAAFGDPGAEQLRDRVRIPVIGIGEAALAEAAAGGRRFGIATSTPRLAGAIERMVRRLGLADAFTGLRVPEDDPLSYDPLAYDPLALAADPARQDAALAAAVAACVARDGAEAVVIGGGPLSGSAARLAHRFAVPIVAPVPAAVRRIAKLPGFTGVDPEPPDDGRR